MEDAIILHLSDLHHGPYHDPNAPGQYKECNQLYRDRITSEFKNAVLSLEPRPNLIIVSGDLTWQADENEFIEAKKHLNELAEVLRINPNERIIVSPGNHDISHSLFQYSPSYELLPYLKFRTELFGDEIIKINKFGDHEKIYEFHDLVQQLGILVFSFNSCIGDDEPKIRKGCLGRLQIRNAANDAKKRLGGKFEKAVKIGVIHHNPFPDRNGIGLKYSTLALKDFGNCGLDILLYGHIHSPVNGKFEDIYTFGSGALGINSRYRPIDQPLTFQYLHIPTAGLIEGSENVIRLQKWKLNTDERWQQDNETIKIPFTRSIDVDFIKLCDIKAKRIGTIAASVFILSENKEQFLLTYSTKFNAWLCPGDEVKRGELLHDCAIRSVLEKVGMNIKFEESIHNPNDEISLDNDHWIVPKPILSVVENQFQHKYKNFPYRCNYYFVATLQGTSYDVPLSMPTKWFTLNEIKLMSKDEVNHEKIPTDLPFVIEKLLELIK